MNAGCRALSLMIATLGLAACGESATLPVAAGMGPDPELPPPQETLIPTVDIAPATDLQKSLFSAPMRQRTLPARFMPGAKKLSRLDR